MTAYYNEFDQKAAAWLRELIKAGLIAPGVIDERSIEDVTPNDLAGFTQCHFFAGIGVWSYALRRAGWDDSRRVWTMSCPCQPFSAAGKGGGFDDERHLWPAGQYLISQCKPNIVFGEQVASKDADTWIDLVHTDMEALGYAFGAVPFPSAGVGAPHIRDRLYWVAESAGDGCTGRGSSRTTETRPTTGRNTQRSSADECGEFPAGFEGSGVELFSGMADSGSTRHEGREWDGSSGTQGSSGGHACQCGGTCRMGNTIEPGLSFQSRHGNRSDEPGRFSTKPSGSVTEASAIVRPGQTNGFWRDADWLGCRDGKWRPVEPSTFPLAHGAAARVGRLRGYGNAINAEAATAFIEAYLGK